MTLKQLESFLIISEKLSFTQAAKEIGIAQSAVTNQIKDLENELNVKLFERIGKSVSLTEEGSRLIPYANRMISVKSDIYNLFNNADDNEAGRIVIGISDILSHTLLPEILREFRYSHQKTKVKLVRTYDVLPGYADTPTDMNPLKLLSDHAIDAAFVMAPSNKLGADFLLHRKSRQNISLLSAYSHDFMGEHRITGEHLSDTQFLLPDKSCCYRYLFEEKLLSEGIIPDVAFESNSIEALKENAATGLGLCLIPENTAKKELMLHSFEKVNFDTSFDVYSLLITHKNKWISGELKDFIDIAKDII